jgi:hypothetical protein
MSFDEQRLYELLPAIYRIRDDVEKNALKELLSVVAEQVGILEEDLAQLYDDQFIETCADWVVPYIGDLIGYRTLHSDVPDVASPRADVANTIAYRRRKGTATMLEQMARDVTGWPARVVEYFQVLATTQHVNHVRLTNQVTPNLRDWELLEYSNTPFDRIPHSIDVRPIDKRAGRYNIPNVGVHLWRIGSYGQTESPAAASDGGPDCWRYRFSPLGLDTTLFTSPERERDITHLAEPINVPMPISRRVLHEHKDRYYGKGKSLAVYESGSLVDSSRIAVFDLSDVEGTNAWLNRPLDPDFELDGFGWVALDPELGRMVFFNVAPSGPVTATYHYGFSADMGGGEYEREATFESGLAEKELVHVEHGETSKPQSIQEGLEALGVSSGAVEIDDGWIYDSPPAIVISDEQKMELRAANGRRPFVRIDSLLEVSGPAGGKGEVTLNGLVISGGCIVVNAGVAKLRLRHCTIVPGQVDGGHFGPLAGPGLQITTSDTDVEIDHCIVLGGIRAARDTHVKASNSIVDATDDAETSFGPATPDDRAGHLSVLNSTVVGTVHTELLELASNAIFLARSEDPAVPPVLADRLQDGCVRFSFVPGGSRVPRQYRCQPELALEMRASELGIRVSELPTAERARAIGRVQPTFTSLHYGDYSYGQLSRLCPEEVCEGADDEAEMGAFHDLYQPQRETNLLVRLQEYLRFGLVAGIFYET